MEKRILIFATTYVPFIGGAEIAVREIIKRLPEYHFDIITVNLDGKQLAKEQIDQVTVYRMGTGRLGKIIFPIRAFFMASHLHREHHYNAFWSIMASYAGMAGLLFSYRHPRLPFVLTLQEGDSIEALRARFQFVWFAIKKIFIRATIIQAISQYLAEFAKAVRPDAPVVVIPNGVDVAKFSFRYVAKIENLKKTLKKNPEDIFLITTSRLVKKNAVGDIISSLQHLPNNVSLLVLGDGPLRGELESGARQDGVSERVMFLGELPHEDIVSYLHVSDVFIRPSISEGFGNSFVEAMAAEIPVIATPVGGIVDFLQDGQTGLFCDVYNPKSIAEKVWFLLDTPQAREEIVRNAKILVTDKYNWDTIAVQMKSAVFKVV